MQLKTIFPGANSSLLAMRQPELVLGFDMVRFRLGGTMPRAGWHVPWAGWPMLDVAIAGIAFVPTTVQTCPEAIKSTSDGTATNSLRVSCRPSLQARLESIAAELRELLPNLNVGALSCGASVVQRYSDPASCLTHTCTCQPGVCLIAARRWSGPASCPGHTATTAIAV